MGVSEAVYRVIPHMKLKDSNIACTFVATGFPENRSLMYKKVKDENSDENALSDQKAEDLDVSQEGETVKLQGQSGNFIQTTTVIERYSVRPEYLESMCLAQFATSYTTIKKPKQIAS